MISLYNYSGTFGGSFAFSVLNNIWFAAHNGTFGVFEDSFCAEDFALAFKDGFIFEGDLEACNSFFAVDSLDGETAAEATDFAAAFFEFGVAFAALALAFGAVLASFLADDGISFFDFWAMFP